MNDPLEAKLAEARAEIDRLKTELELEKTSGDTIMEIRASLHERFGAEVDAAFFDDVIGNALVLATRQAEAITVKLRDELTTRRTYNPECNYCRAFVDVLDSLRTVLAALAEAQAQTKREFDIATSYHTRWQDAEAREAKLRRALERMVRLYESEWDADAPFVRPDWLVAALAVSPEPAQREEKP